MVGGNHVSRMDPKTGKFSKKKMDDAAFQVLARGEYYHS
jgi:hypothetical protein